MDNIDKALNEFMPILDKSESFGSYFGVYSKTKKIKEGQIWRSNYYIEDHRFVITKVVDKNRAYKLGITGFAGQVLSSNITEPKYTLIAEYDNFKEAIASEDFRND